MDSRKTISRMYDVYRLMMKTASDDESPSLPTALRLIRLYGPKLTHGRDSELSLRLDSALPAVLDAMFDSKKEQCTGIMASGSTLSVFECSVESIVALLSESCPKIVNRHGVLVAVETRLTFAEWYRFVLLCIRDCRCVLKI